MTFMLVTYDLNQKNEHPHYGEIQGYLKSLAPMTLLSESSFGITTSKSVTQVYLDLKAMLTELDTLIVVPLGDSWSGQVSTQQESRHGTLQALTSAMGEKINVVKQVVLRPISDVLKEVAENAARAKAKNKL